MTRHFARGVTKKFDPAADRTRAGLCLSWTGGSSDSSILKLMLFESINSELGAEEPKPEVVMIVQALLLSTDAFGGCFTAEDVYLISDENLTVAEIHMAMASYMSTSMVSSVLDEHNRKVYWIADDFAAFLRDNQDRWPRGAYARACLRVLGHLTVRLNAAAEAYHESVSRGVKRFNKLLKFVNLALATDGSGMVRIYGIGTLEFCTTLVKFFCACSLCVYALLL